VKILLATAVVALATAASAMANGSGGISGGGAFYVDGVEYRTVATPTDLSHTGAPAHSFDTIYMLPGQALNVATAAPGDAGYNGGRWMVHLIAYNTSYAATLAAHDANASGDLDSAAEVEAALADPSPGGATDTGVVQSFECPVIKVPPSK
jgi:hypothetical protein